MKIAFCSLHPYWGGLAPNGGSQTILRAAEELKKMGHVAEVVTHTDEFKWFPHPKPLRKMPKGSDLYVAVEITDIDLMISHVPKGAKMAYWMRALALWQLPEKKIAKIIKRFYAYGGIVFCNSTWLYELLGSWGVKASIVYNGIDIDQWYSDVKPVRSDKITIGCLNNTTHQTKNWSLFKVLYKLLGTADYRFVGFGVFKKRPTWLDEYLASPPKDKLSSLYRSAHLWFCPTTLDGFHNVGAEAGLSGSLVVCDRNPRGGMGDYATEETALLYNNIHEAVEKIQNADYSRTRKMQELIINKIGDRPTNMRRLLEAVERNK